MRAEPVPSRLLPPVTLNSADELLLRCKSPEPVLLTMEVQADYKLLGKFLEGTR